MQHRVRSPLLLVAVGCVLPLGGCGVLPWGNSDPETVVVTTTGSAPPAPPSVGPASTTSTASSSSVAPTPTPQQAEPTQAPVATPASSSAVGASSAAPGGGASRAKASSSAPAAPKMEPVTMGPYGSRSACQSAQSVWPTTATACYQSGGSWYFDGMRQSSTG